MFFHPYVATIPNLVIADNYPLSQQMVNDIATSGSGSIASRTSSSLTASNTSKSNAAIGLYLPNGGTFVGMIGVIIGVFIF